MYISIIVVIIIMLSMPLMAFATIVDYDDEPEEQEECEERSDYDHLCNGSTGVTGVPFCDLYGNATERKEQFPNMTGNRCFDRMANPVNFCETFDDLTATYEDCRKVPGSEEFYEYLKTGGPDESCLFDVYQIKCQPDPLTDECPPDFGSNEDGYCFPRTNGEWKCPDGYHGTDDDETGQCYPNSEGCDAYILAYEGDDKVEYILVEGEEEGESDMCRDPGRICDGVAWDNVSKKKVEEPIHPDCDDYLEFKKNN